MLSILYTPKPPGVGWADFGPRAAAASGIFVLWAFLVASWGQGLVGVGGRAVCVCGPWGPACEFTDFPGGRPVHSLGDPGPYTMCKHARPTFGYAGGNDDHTGRGLHIDDRAADPEEKAVVNQSSSRQHGTCITGASVSLLDCHPGGYFRSLIYPLSCYSHVGSSFKDSEDCSHTFGTCVFYYQRSIPGLLPTGYPSCSSGCAPLVPLPLREAGPTWPCQRRVVTCSPSGSMDALCPPSHTGEGHCKPLHKEHLSRGLSLVHCAEIAGVCECIGVYRMMDDWMLVAIMYIEHVCPCDRVCCSFFSGSNSYQLWLCAPAPQPLVTETKTPRGMFNTQQNQGSFYSSAQSMRAEEGEGYDPTLVGSDDWPAPEVLPPMMSPPPGAPPAFDPPLGKGSANMPTPSTMAWAFPTHTRSPPQQDPGQQGTAAGPATGPLPQSGQDQQGATIDPITAGSTYTPPEASTRPPPMHGDSVASAPGQDPTRPPVSSPMQHSAQDGMGTNLGKGTPTPGSTGTDPSFLRASNQMRPQSQGGPELDVRMADADDYTKNMEVDATSHGLAPPDMGTTEGHEPQKGKQDDGRDGSDTQGGARVTPPSLPLGQQSAAPQSTPLTREALQTLGGHTTKDHQEGDGNSLGMSSTTRRQQRNKLLQETELPPRVNSKYHSKGVRNGLEIVRIVEHDLPPLAWISGVPAPYGKDVHMSDGSVMYVPPTGTVAMGYTNKTRLCGEYVRTGMCPYQNSREKPCTESHSPGEQKQHGHIRVSTDLPQDEADAFPTNMQPCLSYWADEGCPIGRECGRYHCVADGNITQTMVRHANPALKEVITNPHQGRWGPDTHTLKDTCKPEQLYRRAQQNHVKGQWTCGICYRTNPKQAEHCYNCIHLGVQHSRAVKLDTHNHQIVVGQYEELGTAKVRPPPPRDWQCYFCQELIYGKKHEYCTSCMMLYEWICDKNGWQRMATQEDEEELKARHYSRYMQLLKERDTRKVELDQWKAEQRAKWGSHKTGSIASPPTAGLAGATQQPAANPQSTGAALQPAASPLNTGMGTDQPKLSPPSRDAGHNTSGPAVPPTITSAADPPGTRAAGPLPPGSEDRKADESDKDYKRRWQGRGQGAPPSPSPPQDTASSPQAPGPVQPYFNMGDMVHVRQMLQRNITPVESNQFWNAYMEGVRMLERDEFLPQSKEYLSQALRKQLGIVEEMKLSYVPSVYFSCYHSREQEGWNGAGSIIGTGIMPLITKDGKTAPPPDHTGKVRYFERQSGPLILGVGREHSISIELLIAMFAKWLTDNTPIRFSGGISFKNGRGEVLSLDKVRTENAQAVITHLCGEGLHLYSYQEKAIREAYQERVSNHAYVQKKVEEARAAARSQGRPEPQVGALPKESHDFLSAEAEEFLKLADAKAGVPSFSTMNGAGRLYVQCTNVRCGALAPALSLLDGTSCTCGAIILPSWDRLGLLHGSHCHSTIHALNHQAAIGFGEVMGARRVKRHLKDTAQGQAMAPSDLAPRELETTDTDEWLPLITGPMVDHLYQRQLEQRTLQAQIDKEIKDEGRPKTMLLPTEQYSKHYPAFDIVRLTVVLGRSIFGPTQGLYHPIQELKRYPYTGPLCVGPKRINDKGKTQQIIHMVKGQLNPHYEEVFPSAFDHPIDFFQDAQGKVDPFGLSVKSGKGLGPTGNAQVEHRQLILSAILNQFVNKAEAFISQGQAPQATPEQKASRTTTPMQVDSPPQEDAGSQRTNRETSGSRSVSRSVKRDLPPVPKEADIDYESPPAAWSYDPNKDIYTTVDGDALEAAHTAAHAVGSRLSQCANKQSWRGGTHDGMVPTFLAVHRGVRGTEVQSFVPHLGLHHIPGCTEMQDIYHPKFAGRATRYGRTLATGKRKHLPTWTMVESHEALYQAASNLSRSTQSWVRNLGAGGSVTQGMEDACHQLDPQQYQPGTLNALKEFCKTIEECNAKVAQEGAEMAGLEATIAALHRLLGKVQKCHETSKGVAEYKALQMHTVLTECLEVIVRNEDSRALEFIAQFQDSIAGARAYSDMLAAREVRVADPIHTAEEGLTITGAVPWDDSPHEYGFRQGMVGIETCVAELSKGLQEDEEGPLANLLYHQNSTKLFHTERPNVYSGDLTVPGFPTMAPVGTGQDRVLSHTKAIQNMLAAAEEKITQAVAYRRAQAEAQGSRPDAASSTRGGTKAENIGPMEGGTTFPAVLMEPANVRFASIYVLYEDTHTKLHQKLKATFGKQDCRLQVMAATEGQHHQILESTLRIRDLPYLIIGREVQTVQLAVSVEATQPPTPAAATPSTGNDGPGAGTGDKGQSGDGTRSTGTGPHHTQGGQAPTSGSGNSTGTGTHQHGDAAGAEVSVEANQQPTPADAPPSTGNDGPGAGTGDKGQSGDGTRNTGTGPHHTQGGHAPPTGSGNPTGTGTHQHGDAAGAEGHHQPGTDWTYPQEGMRFKVIMSAKTGQATKIVDETTMWVAPNASFANIHDQAHRLFHVSDISTTATWEVRGAQPNPYKPCDIKTKDKLHAKQLPALFSKQDLEGLCLHLRCNYTKEAPTIAPAKKGYALVHTQLVLMGVSANQATLETNTEDTVHDLSQMIRRFYKVSDNLIIELELTGLWKRPPCKLEDLNASIKDLPGFDATQYTQPFCIVARCGPLSGRGTRTNTVDVAAPTQAQPVTSSTGQAAVAGPYARVQGAPLNAASVTQGSQAASAAPNPPGQEQQHPDTKRIPQSVRGSKHPTVIQVAYYGHREDGSVHLCLKRAFTLPPSITMDALHKKLRLAAMDFAPLSGKHGWLVEAVFDEGTLPRRFQLPNDQSTLADYHFYRETPFPGLEQPFGIQVRITPAAAPTRPEEAPTNQAGLGWRRHAARKPSSPDDDSTSTADSARSRRLSRHRSTSRASGQPQLRRESSRSPLAHRIHPNQLGHTHTLLPVHYNVNGVPKGSSELCVEHAHTIGRIHHDALGVFQMPERTQGDIQTLELHQGTPRSGQGHTLTDPQAEVRSLPGYDGELVRQDISLTVRHSTAGYLHAQTPDVDRDERIAEANLLLALLNPTASAARAQVTQESRAALAVLDKFVQGTDRETTDFSVAGKPWPKYEAYVQKHTSTLIALLVGHLPQPLDLLEALGYDRYGVKTRTAAQPWYVPPDALGAASGEVPGSLDLGPPPTQEDFLRASGAQKSQDLRAINFAESFFKDEPLGGADNPPHTAGPGAAHTPGTSSAADTVTIDQIQEDPHSGEPIQWGHVDGEVPDVSAPIMVTHKPPAPPAGWQIGFDTRLEWWYYYTPMGGNSPRRQYIHPHHGVVYATRARPMDCSTGAGREYRLLSIKIRRFLFVAGTPDGKGGMRPHLYAPGTTDEQAKALQELAQSKLTATVEAYNIKEEVRLYRYVHEHAVDIVGWLLRGPHTVQDLFIVLGISPKDFPHIIGDALIVRKRERTADAEEGKEIVLSRLADRYKGPPAKALPVTKARRAHLMDYKMQQLDEKARGLLHQRSKVDPTLQTTGGQPDFANASVGPWTTGLGGNYGRTAIEGTQLHINMLEVKPAGARYWIRAKLRISIEATLRCLYDQVREEYRVEPTNHIKLFVGKRVLQETADSIQTIPGFSVPEPTQMLVIKGFILREGPKHRGGQGLLEVLGTELTDQGQEPPHFYVRNATTSEEEVHVVQTATNATLYDLYEAVRHSFNVPQGVGLLYSETLQGEVRLPESADNISIIPGYVQDLVIQDTMLTLRKEGVPEGTPDPTIGVEGRDDTQPDGHRADPEVEASEPQPSAQAQDTGAARGGGAPTTGHAIPVHQGHAEGIDMETEGGPSRGHQIWIEPHMKFGDIKEGVEKLLGLQPQKDSHEVFWKAGNVRVHVMVGDSRTVDRLPELLGIMGYDQVRIHVAAPGPSSSARAQQEGPLRGMPTRPVPVPLPRPPPPAQYPAGAVIVDTLKPPDVPEGYDIHIHVPTQKWYFAKDQATQWLHPITGHTYQIGQQSSKMHQGKGHPVEGWSADGHIPHTHNQQEVPCPLHVRQRVLVWTPQVPQPWQVHTTKVCPKEGPPYTLWFYTREECWSWVHPEEYATARQAASEEEYKLYGEGQAVQLNLKGQPVPPKAGRGKRRVTFDPTTPASGAKATPTVPTKAPPPSILHSLLKGLGGKKQSE